MNEIQVNFVLSYGTNVEVKVPEDMTVKEALEELVEAELLHEPGMNKEWFVMFNESRQEVDISKTIAENGITDGDCLKVFQPSTKSDEDAEQPVRKIRISFVRQDDREEKVWIPQDTIVKAALDQLTESGLLDAPGENMEWFAALFEEKRKEGRMIDISGTMEENGVGDGSVLYLGYMKSGEKTSDESVFLIDLACSWRGGRNLIAVTGRKIVEDAVKQAFGPWEVWLCGSGLLDESQLVVYKMDGEKVNISESFEANGIAAGTMLRVTTPNERVGVNFLFPNGRKESVSFREDMEIKDVLEELVKVRMLEPLGEKDEWTLINERDKKHVDVSGNAIRNGILPNDTLYVRASKEMKITFVLRQDDAVEVRVPMDMFMEDALEQLVEANWVSPLRGAMDWVVWYDTENEDVYISVDITKTFAENGIADGSRLRVDQYGC